MDDLDHLLAGFDRTDHILPDGFFFDRPNKALDHWQRHIGLKERHADFAKGCRHVLFRERPASGQPVKYAAKAVCQCVEHQLVSFRFAPPRTRWGAIHPSANRKCPAERNFAERGASPGSHSIAEFVRVKARFSFCAGFRRWLKHGSGVKSIRYRKFSLKSRFDTLDGF